MEELFPLTHKMFLLLAIILPLVVVWTAVWKGLALWKAGTNRHLVWFVILFILNTAGILEIVYIFAISPKGIKSGS